MYAAFVKTMTQNLKKSALKFFNLLVVLGINVLIMKKVALKFLKAKVLIYKGMNLMNVNIKLLMKSLK